MRAPTGDFAVRLELSGTPRCVPAETPAVPLAPLDGALFALLALEGPTPRGRIAALLWPDSEPALARAALRQRLYQLRRQLGRDLVEGTTTLALADGVEHDLAGTSGVLGALDFDAQGELAEWLATQRRTRRERRLDHLAREAEQAEAGGELAAALGFAQALVQANPTSEHAHRRVMRLHYLRGDAAAALAAFDACAQALREALGAKPSYETVALRAQIEQARPPVRAPERDVRQPLPAGMLRPPRLVGRDDALRAAHAGWAAGQVVLVTGEAGLGKSRLLQELALGEPGVVAATARPGDAVVPYAAMARLLRALAEAPRANLRNDAGAPRAIEAPARHEGGAGRSSGRGSLAVDRGATAVADGDSGVARDDIRVVRDDALPARNQAAPYELVVDRPAIPSPSALAALPAQRGAEAVLQAARTAGVSTMLLDDLQFADEASVELLTALVTQRDGGGGPRFAFAQRPGEGPAALATLADALLEDHALAIVPVEPLTAAAMREFVASLDLGLDTTATDRLAAHLQQHSGGNPLFALETLRQAWIERRLTATDLPRPLNVARLIERRLARLSPEALRLARCAAVAGTDFAIELAARVLGAGVLDLADAWAELEAAQVLRDGAFAHDLIFEATRASVPQPIARHLHGEIADYLAARDAEPARLAVHWDSAQRWADAARAYTRAAERAHHDGRRTEEAALLAHAARCHEAAGEADQRFEALHARADVLVRFDAGELTARAVAEAEAAARTEAQALRAALGRVAYEDARGAVAEVIRLAPPALARAQAMGDQGLALRLAAVLAQSLSDARRASEAITLLAPLRPWIETAATPEQQFEYWMACGLSNDYANRLTDALPAWESARTVAQRAARGDLAWKAMISMAATLSKLGYVARGADLGLQALAHARADAQLPPGRVHRAQVTVAHRLRDLGRYAEALTMLEDALAFFKRYEREAASAAAVALRLSQAYLQLGQPARAQALLALEPGQYPMNAVLLHVHRADLARHLGQPVVALREFRTAIDLMPNPDDIYHRVACLFGAAIVPPDEGEAMATDLAAWASAHQRSGLALAGHVLAAACALAQNAPRRALPQAEAALRLAAHYQTDSFYLPQVWLVAGKAFAAAGRPDDAARTIAEGVAWVRATADNVPAVFRDSFLNRNPVNRELLTLATRTR